MSCQDGKIVLYLFSRCSPEEEPRLSGSVEAISPTVARSRSIGAQGAAQAAEAGR